MKVYLIRHGETDMNKAHGLQGHTDIELNDYGRKLADITGKALSDVKFDYVFTSPLKRAKETASIIIKNQKEEVKLEEEERIKEICFGEYEGLCYDEDNFTIPDKSFMNFFTNPSEYNVPKGGESFEDVIKRTGKFWEDLITDEKYSDKTILVSTHGCALKAILAGIKNIEIKDFWGEGVHKNCAVTIIEVKDEKMNIEEGKIFYQS